MSASSSSQPVFIKNADVQRSLSGPRLASFRLNSTESDDIVFARYRWNLALGQSFYPSLGLLEVTLRNHMHIVISGHYKTNSWYDSSPSILRQHELDAVQKAKGELGKQGKTLDPDRIVAELSFGFWVGLLSRNYETAIWHKNNNLAQTFPYSPKSSRKRQMIANSLHRIRLLRNRISHHEPIFKMRDLKDISSKIHEMIQWMSPSMLHWLPIGDDFATIFNRGEAAYHLPKSQMSSLLSSSVTPSASLTVP